ncbi:N-acetylglucosamine kinase [Salibacterium aidingense]|uniref:N-acetylglucosamine kinase n=1 Tax=Salibacterium aidingense TaxID=384933 RepID=UPI00040CA4A5|nr:BadF/BadG/BcrA/BcrD ATPase family protein [Salibacterium aidingense]
MGIIAGIDGGGTKTVCRLKDVENDNIPFTECSSGPSNPQAVGVTASLSTITALLDKTLLLNGTAWNEVSVISAGIAGLSTREEKKHYQSRLTKAVLNSYCSEYLNIHIENDAMIALRTDIPPEESGILLASGTGSIAYGIDTVQKEWRSGGWGYLIGDEGSGYWIGREALAAATAAHDKRGGATELLQAVLEAWELSEPAELSKFVYQSHDTRMTIAGLAKLVATKAEEGDVFSRKILEEAGEHLVNLLFSVYHQSSQFQTPIPTVFHGSVLEHISLVRRTVEKELPANMFQVRFGKDTAPPVEGALNIARSLALKTKE